MEQHEGQSEPKRTAVLVVHGMGSQRPLDTVRGILEAVWHEDIGKVVTWVHPEPSGIDLDLSVFTTQAVERTANRNVDFHELYWAHLMSETRAVAVLLWLFELSRRGPYLNPRMIILWWGIAVFLAFLVLSVSFLTIQGVVYLAGTAGHPQALIEAIVAMALIGAAATVGYSWYKKAKHYAWVVGRYVLAGIVVAAVVYFWPLPQAVAPWLANQFLALGVAAIAIALMMGVWGLVAFAIAVGLSFASMALYVVLAAIAYPIWGHWDIDIAQFGLPWHLKSPWSAISAWVLVGVYIIMNAWFLVPYLGDVARYFRNSPANVAGRREIRRQAVKTLAGLHTSGQYDRIVVVAHSLGTAVAYDMLRAYYARIADHIPAPAPGADPDLDAINDGKGTRNLGRAYIRKMAAAVGRLAPGDRLSSRPRDVEAWLVTDFVTLGSPLAHAAYLMCRGDDRTTLWGDFEARKNEREFPTCPPRSLYGDRLLTFDPQLPKGAPRRFHHGGMFALTRWTNIYFPMSQVVWGDVIGGPLGHLFERELDDTIKDPQRECFGLGIKDVPVWTEGEQKPDFFAHVKYWDVECAPKKRCAPHIKALREAINLADKDEA